jgi:chemotaxis protein methyltransferase CheR
MSERLASHAPEAANGVRPLTDREFRLLQKLIYQEAGIFLSDAKKALVSGRLTRRVRALGLNTFSAYYEAVEENRDGERTQMLDSICTNETKFFREPKQFELLEQVLLPQWKSEGASGARPKRIRAWSAACSTGEEPYSLAMVLARYFPRDEGWSIEIVASDLSTKVLASAREGVWPIERADDIPSTYKRSFMLRGTGPESSKMRAQPALKSMIEFRSLNLAAERYDLRGKFDLIFCRNVLIYFNRDSKHAVLQRLIQQLAPSGYLFLGHSESLSGAAHDLTNAGPAVYCKKPVDPPISLTR